MSSIAGLEQRVKRLGGVRFVLSWNGRERLDDDVGSPVIDEHADDRRQLLKRSRRQSITDRRLEFAPPRDGRVTPVESRRAVTQNCGVLDFRANQSKAEAPTAGKIRGRAQPVDPVSRATAGGKHRGARWPRVTNAIPAKLRRGRGGDRRAVSSQRDAARAWAGGGFGLVRAAVACPGDGLEPLLVDVLAAVLAQAEGAGVDARQCQADFL